MMARSHVGRLLEDRISQEINKLAQDVISVEINIETLRYSQGQVAGMKRVIQMLDELEKD